MGLIFLRGGYDEGLLGEWIKKDFTGMVIAGFGAGTIPDTVANRISQIERSGCVIVVSSRVPRVMVISETMTKFEGCNTIPSGFLNPQKSALLLLSLIHI